MKNLFLLLAFFALYSCGSDDDISANLTENEVRVYIDDQLAFKSIDNFINSIDKDIDNNGVEYFGLGFFAKGIDNPLYNLNLSLNLDGVNGAVSVIDLQGGIDTNNLLYDIQDDPCGSNVKYFESENVSVDIITQDGTASGVIELPVILCTMTYNPLVRVEFSGIDVDYD